MAGNVHPEERTHVVHVISGLGLGGAERTLEQLVSRIDPRRFRSSVISLTTPGDVGARLRQSGFAVEALGMTRTQAIGVGIFRLGALVKRLHPDILQTWMYHADFLGLLAAHLHGMKSVAWNVRGTARSWRAYGLATWLTVRACALLSTWPEVVVVNSIRGREEHARLGYHPGQWAVIPNGVDLDRFRPDGHAREALRRQLGVGDGEIAVGSVARFHPMKGHAHLIEAVASLGVDPPVRLVLVGQGTEPGSPILDEWVRRAGLEGRVIRLGRRDDIPALMNVFDVFVLSSAGESFPNVVAEAMATQVPCVVTDVGDAGVIVGDAGVVVEGGDGPALAAGMRRLIVLGPAQRHEMGVRAAERVRSQFDLKRMVEAYEALYSEMRVTGRSA